MTTDMVEGVVTKVTEDGIVHSVPHPDRAVEEHFLFGFVLHLCGNGAVGATDRLGAYEWLSGKPLGEIEHYKFEGSDREPASPKHERLKPPFDYRADFFNDN